MTTQGGQERSQPDPRRIPRRVVGAGAAWAVPVIAVGTAAPAMAASVCPVIPAFSAANGWGLSQTGSGQGGSARFENGQFVVDTDAAALTTYTATASRSLSFVAGVQYTFVLAFSAYVANARPMRLTLLVNGTALSPSPLVDTGTLTANNGSSTTHTATRTATYVAVTGGTATLALTDSVTSSLTTTGDDITVTSLSVLCA